VYIKKCWVASTGCKHCVCLLGWNGSDDTLFNRGSTLVQASSTIEGARTEYPRTPKRHDQEGLAVDVNIKGGGTKGLLT